MARRPEALLLATTASEFRGEYGFSATGVGKRPEIWVHRERAAEPPRNPGKQTAWKANYEAAKAANPNLETELVDYRNGLIKQWNIDHDWPDGVKPTDDADAPPRPKKLRTLDKTERAAVSAEPVFKSNAHFAKWPTEAAAVLAAAVDEVETTLTRSKADEEQWGVIANNVNAQVEGAYTGTQCYSKAHHMGLLETTKMPPFRHYFPGAKPPLVLTGLDAGTLCGEDAWPAFADLLVKICRRRPSNFCAVLFLKWASSPWPPTARRSRTH